MGLSVVADRRVTLGPRGSRLFVPSRLACRSMGLLRGATGVGTKCGITRMVMACWLVPWAVGVHELPIDHISYENLRQKGAARILCTATLLIGHPALLAAPKNVHRRFPRPRGDMRAPSEAYDHQPPTLPCADVRQMSLRGISKKSRRCYSTEIRRILGPPVTLVQAPTRHTLLFGPLAATRTCWTRGEC